jgi:hypothetical protein
MSSSGTSTAEHLLEGMQAAVASNKETQRLLQELLKSNLPNQPPGTASSVVIHAGGIANAIAVCTAACSVVLFLVFAGAMTWLYAQERGSREAWSEVYSREQAKIRLEWQQFREEQKNAGR